MLQHLRMLTLLLVVLPALGCGTNGGDPDGGTDGGAVEPSRVVVVSHPYLENRDPSGTYEVLTLDPAGELSTTGESFELRRPGFRAVQFTPNGEVGVVAQSDGTLGVFRVDAEGAVTVVHDGFEGTFYAEDVVMDPDGSRLYVVDPNWENNGGGIYEVLIGSDGTLTEGGRLFESRNAGGLHLLPDGRAVLAARGFGGTVDANDAFLLSWGATPTLIAAVDAFGDDEASISATAVTWDGTHLLIADNSAFSGIPNRVAVVRISADSLTAVQVLTPFNDPGGFATSPYDNAALVANVQDNAILHYTYDAGDATTPFTPAGEPAYSDTGPLLPVAMSQVQQGGLLGHVIVGENVKVRHLAFRPDGSVADLGTIDFGSGYAAIVGPVGVQP